MSKLKSVLATRDVAMAAYLDHALSKSKLNLSQEQRDGLYKAAEEFHESSAGKAFLQSSKDAVSKHQDV